MPGAGAIHSINGEHTGSIHIDIVEVQTAVARSYSGQLTAAMNATICTRWNGQRQAKERPHYCAIQNVRVPPAQLMSCLASVSPCSFFLYGSAQ